MFYPYAQCNPKSRITRFGVEVPLVCLYQSPKTFVQEKVNHSYINIKEAHSLIQYAKSFTNRSVVIITPYKAQLRLLYQSQEKSFECFTADTYQGQEADIVLVSLVRSGGEIGFLTDPRRLNMVMTRAAYHIALFGHFDGYCQHPTWETFCSVYADRMQAMPRFE